jgi:hypothetical protein
MPSADRASGLEFIVQFVQIEGDDGLLFCCRHPNVLQPCLGLFMHWLGHSTRDVGHLVDPAALFFRRRVLTVLSTKPVDTRSP